MILKMLHLKNQITVKEIKEMQEINTFESTNLRRPDDPRLISFSTEALVTIPFNK